MTTVASASVPMYAPFTSPYARKNGAMSGPTLPTSAERKLNTAPMAAKARTPGRHTGARGTCRHSTTPSKNAPTSRSSARSGAVANSNAAQQGERHCAEREPSHHRDRHLAAVEPHPAAVADELRHGEDRDRVPDAEHRHQRREQQRRAPKPRHRCERAREEGRAAEQQPLRRRTSHYRSPGRWTPIIRPAA